MILKGIRLTKMRTKKGWGSKVYKTTEWRKYSDYYLMLNPECVVCGREAKVVDHKIPILQGGSMWEHGNHQALCKSCHAKKTGSDNEYNGMPRY